MLGGSSQYARDYFFIISLGAPFVIGSLSLNNMVYAEGNGNVGFFALTFSSILNIFLDWLFIAQLDMAVKGVAIATLISQIVGSVILLCYFLLPVSHIKLNLDFRMRQVREILRIGISAAARTFSVVFSGFAMNRQALAVGGEPALAVVSVIFRVIGLVVLPAFGINQAFLSIAAYNYGAQNFERVRKVARQAVLLALGICYTAVLGVWIFAVDLAKLFNPDPAFTEMAVQGFRTAFLFSPLLMFNLVSSGLYQAMGRASLSLLTAVSRILFFVLPLVIILPSFLGIMGIWLSLPLGELLSAVFSILMILPALKELRKTPTVLQEKPLGSEG